MKTFVGVLTAALLAITVSVCSPVKADTVLFQDNFNTENGGTGALNYTGFGGWDVTRGTVDLIGNGFFDFYPGNGLYVDLDGSTFAAGKMETKTGFSLFSADTYQLDFDLGGSTRGDTNTVAASLDGMYAELFTLPSAAPLSHYTRLIHPFGDTVGAKIVFDHAGGDNLGLILDNVKLTKLDRKDDCPGAPVTPEPCSLSLLGLGGLPLINRLRRRSA